MEYFDHFIKWDDDKGVLDYLNREIYEIAEDPCITPYQCLQILEVVKNLMIQRAYCSLVKHVSGKSTSFFEDISRNEAYQYLYDLYYENICHQCPYDDENDLKGYFGKIEITIFIGEKTEVIHSIENFVSCMIETNNWLKPDKILIKWKEPGMINYANFDSTDSNNW